LTDDLHEACKWLEEKGIQFKKKPDEGNMRSIAFALDPNGYWIEIIQRGWIVPEKKVVITEVLTTPN
jgi:lactoylglutathione lyase